MAAFIYKRGTGSYLRTREIHIDSSIDKEDENQSDFLFNVVLVNEIQNVISITLSSWNIDKDITPSFWPPNGTVAGNDMLDIEISNAGYNGGTPFTLSIQLPNANLYWDKNAPKDSNFASVVENLLYAARDAYDKSGLAQLRFTCEYLIPGSFSLFTFLDRFVVGPMTGASPFTLLFQTGPNSDRSCYSQLGFEKLDYDSIDGFALGTITLSGNSQGVASPNPIQLQTFKYVDVNVAQSNKTPVHRIFTTNPSVFRNEQSASTLRQQKVDTDQPPRTLKKMSIQILYPGGVNPALYLSRQTPIQFTFTVLQVAQETDELPSYMKQTLAM